MAYVGKEDKARLAPGIKAVLKKYDTFIFDSAIKGINLET